MSGAALRRRAPETTPTPTPTTTDSSVATRQDRIIKVLLGVSAASFVLVVSIVGYFVLAAVTVAPPPNDQKTQNHRQVDPTRYGQEYIPYNWITKQVPRIRWQPDKEFAHTVSQLQEPVILYNTVVDNWRARRLWNPEYFIQHTPHFNGVQKHSEKTFSYFHHAHPMSHLKGINETYKRNTYEKLNMTAKDFFDAIQNPPPYYYYATEANDLGAPYNDLYPVEPLMVINDNNYKLEESYLHRWTNVWIGPAGATTHTHYDISENFYAQIYGRKRFILIPPDHVHNLYLFPFLHPGAQQSQVRLDLKGGPDYVKFPKFANVQAMEAILEPGDVLYLPPLWFHHVTALSLSMSVSVWSKSPETESMYKTVRGALPFKASWTAPTLALAARRYLTILIEKVYGEGSAVPFVKRLFETRYQPLLSELPHLLKRQHTVDGSCWHANPRDVAGCVVSGCG